jgi:hypothetical protein
MRGMNVYIHGNSQRNGLTVIPPHVIKSELCAGRFSARVFSVRMNIGLQLLAVQSEALPHLLEVAT